MTAPLSLRGPDPIPENPPPSPPAYSDPSSPVYLSFDLPRPSLAAHSAAALSHCHDRREGRNPCLYSDFPSLPRRSRSSELTEPSLPSLLLSSTLSPHPCSTLNQTSP
eukprot:434932-Rhodomonas_salina.1